MEQRIDYSRNYFYKGDEPFMVISGTIHYFRVVPEYWDDRLKKLRSFGCNCVDTFVPWIFHEPQKGTYNFSGLLNLEDFIQKAAALKLSVILRPGPYIAAEVEAGGIPPWVTMECGGKIRCSEPVFLELVEGYIKKLSSIIRPYLYFNGGPVVLIQIENEYGSYGNDQEYMGKLYKLYSEYLDEVVFTTGDQPDLYNMKHGKAKDALTTVYFGSKADERFANLKKHLGEKPLMCSEFWSGWYDYWQGNHHIRSAESTAESFDEILKNDASVNIYMFHGGTNFGFTNGAALVDDVYRPVVTSYDFDALLTESGDITEKYVLCREKLERYVELEPLEKIVVPERIEKKNMTFPQRATLFEALQHISTPVFSPTTLTMDELGQNSGFILYRCFVEGPLEDAELKIVELRDRAQIFINKKYYNTLYRSGSIDTLIIDIPSEGAWIDILVENMGRINYGPNLGEEKGITKGVLINNQFLFNWEIHPLPLDNIDMVPFEPNASYEIDKTPAFYHASFSVERPRDTFVLFDGWKKGVCYINSFNLGRYWNEGPQQTLYVPAPLLRKGKNSLVVFELYSPEELSIEFVKDPVYGKRSQIKKSILSRLFTRT